MTTDPYHVVKCSHNGEFRTYEIYRDNQPSLVPAKGAKLGKRDAYTITRLLNALVEIDAGDV